MMTSKAKSSPSLPSRSSLGTEITLRAEFMGFRFQSPERNFSILSLRVLENKSGSVPASGSFIAAVGTTPDITLRRGLEVEVAGTWGSHPRFGEQLRMSYIRIVDPVDEKGIIAYLSSGVVKGIGPATAQKLIAHFGADTLNVLDMTPERIQEIPGIGKRLSEKIISSWKEQRSAAALIMTLCSLGLSVGFARKASKLFGEAAAEKIRKNPYILVQIRGVGFLKADQIARQVGIAENAPERIKAGLLYCLQEATYSDGHCYLPTEELITKGAALMELGKEIVTHVFRNDMTGTTDDFLEGQAVHEDGRVYLKEIYLAERAVAQKIRELAGQKGHPGIDAHLMEEVLTERCPTLTEEQRRGVVNALVGSRISVLAGLPGTGKTFTVKALLEVLDACRLSYALAAPTGKASKRVNEQTGREAKTIHRLLEFKKGGGFQRDENNPLDADFIIIDETSMVDILLMRALLRAISGNTCLILIGDPHQLPSVGPGNVLRDTLKDSLCSAMELTKIQRQAADSPIIQVAHAIYRGNRFTGLDNGSDFRFIRAETPEKIAQISVKLACGGGPFAPEQVQVLTPMKKGVIGSYELNAVIQRGLAGYKRDLLKKMGYEPSSEVIEGIPFAPGDRVIQLVNNYNKEVFNGECGYVVNSDRENRELSVLFDDRVLTYDDDDFDQLALAYALTIHKSQGSEFPCVILPVHTTHYIMLYRQLLYTAVTRARQSLILVGTEKAAAIAVGNNKPLMRYTDLSR